MYRWHRISLLDLCYVFKIRTNAGRPIILWWVKNDQIHKNTFMIDGNTSRQILEFQVHVNVHNHVSNWILTNLTFKSQIVTDVSLRMDRSYYLVLLKISSPVESLKMPISTKNSTFRNLNSVILSRKWPIKGPQAKGTMVKVLRKNGKLIHLPLIMVNHVYLCSIMINHF